MRISVIIPSYNQGRFIEQTFLSVLQQEYADVEIIMIDGGSQDETLEIIDRYSKFVSYWISEKDRGQSHALNKGLEVCTGDFIGWMNSDDVYLPGAFRELDLAVNEAPSRDIFYANRININGEGLTLRKIIYARPVPYFLPFYATFRGMVFCNQAAFFRSTVFRDVGRFDERFHIAMDTDFFYRCVISGKTFHYTNSFWGAWRDHDSAKTASSTWQSRKRIEERQMFNEKHKIYRGAGAAALSTVAGVWRRVLLATQAMKVPPQTAVLESLPT